MSTTTKRSRREPTLPVIQAFHKQKELVDDLERRVAQLGDDYMSYKPDTTTYVEGGKRLSHLLRTKKELKAAISKLDLVGKQVIPFLPGGQYWAESLPPEGADQSSIEQHLRKLAIDLSNNDTNLDKMIGDFRSLAKSLDMLDRLKEEEYLNPFKHVIQNTLKEAMKMTDERIYCRCKEGVQAVKRTANRRLTKFYGTQFWGCPFWISEQEPGCGFIQNIPDGS